MMTQQTFDIDRNWGFGMYCNVGVVGEKEKEINRLCNVIVPYITVAVPGFHRFGSDSMYIQNTAYTSTTISSVACTHH